MVILNGTPLDVMAAEWDDEQLDRIRLDAWKIHKEAKRDFPEASIHWGNVAACLEKIVSERLRERVYERAC